MTLITLDGLDDQTLVNTDTKPSGGGLRPFPCDNQGWVKHTAVVMSADIKSFDSGRDSISLVVANGQYGGELLIDLDPKGAPDPQKALETRNKAIKILNAVTDGKLDSAKVKKSHGQLVEIIARHKGFTQGKNGRWYHKVSLILTGEVAEMLPVAEIPMPALPDSQAAHPTDNDIVF